MAKSNTYYYTLIHHEFKPVQARKILIFEEVPYTFFVYCNPNVFHKYWVVESISGLGIGSGRKLKEAIANAESNLKKIADIDKRIQYSISEYGKAPEPYKGIKAV